LDDVGGGSGCELHGNHGVQEDFPGATSLETQQEQGDADFAEGDAPAPGELAEEEEATGGELGVGRDVDVVVADAVGDGREEDGELGCCCGLGMLK